jgi:uncharacterized protein (DUF2062 family)
MASLVERWVVLPVKGLLKMGASPERLAWSLAVGIVVGVNPLLGSTTLLALGLAALFRLNVVASQVGNHAMYPFELALFPVFIKLGSILFETEKLPIQGKKLFEAARAHPWDTTRILWRWEWHALVIWAMFATVALPALGFGLAPLLNKMQRRMRRRALV